MAMLVLIPVKTGVLHMSSYLTVMMRSTKPHPHSSMVVMVKLVLMLLRTLRLLSLSAAGQQHKMVGVAGVLTRDPLWGDTSRHSCDRTTMKLGCLAVIGASFC